MVFFLYLAYIIRNVEMVTKKKKKSVLDLAQQCAVGDGKIKSFGVCVKSSEAKVSFLGEFVVFDVFAFARDVRIFVFCVDVFCFSVQSFDK